MKKLDELNPPQRTLLGPGPSNVHPRVYRALATPIVGHLDPYFLEVMNEIQELLRFVFQTENRLTVAVSGTGSAGMEAALVNVVEPGDHVVVGVNGVFGRRMAEIVRRCGAEAVEVHAPRGRPVDPNQIEDALKRTAPVKAVAVVHAETSTGVLQPLTEIGALCRQFDALFIVDTVTSLGGLPVKVDAWGIDVCYSGTQKCLSCPPGLAPITLSERALRVLQHRKTPVQSWYLDLSLVADYWQEGKRAYHHTAPISMNYALREALRLVQEEGLEARWERHQRNSSLLLSGLSRLGLTPFVEEAFRLPTLNAVQVPDGVDEAEVRRTLLQAYDIEIGGGLGDLAGKIWRIGLMGESSAKANVVHLLAALEEILQSLGMAE